MLFQSTPVVKAVVLFSFCFLLIIGIVLALFVPELLIRIRPLQREQVEVVGKRTATALTSAAYGLKEQKKPNCFITFKFSDGTKKELRVTYNIYESMQEGETGILIYQERKNAKKWSQRYFIGFEKDS